MENSEEINPEQINPACSSLIQTHCHIIPWRIHSPTARTESSSRLTAYFIAYNCQEKGCSINIHILSLEIPGRVELVGGGVGLGEVVGREEG